MSRFIEGQRVRAVGVITESGKEPDRTAKDLHNPGWVHAEAGELGTVELVDAGNGNIATVRFDRTGTATIVLDKEIELSDEMEEV